MQAQIHVSEKSSATTPWQGNIRQKRTETSVTDQFKFNPEQSLPEKSIMGSSAIQQGPNVPRTRQRKVKAPPELEVPDIQENAAERKRVLNILAQRRYRTQDLTP